VRRRQRKKGKENKGEAGKQRKIKRVSTETFFQL